MLTRIALPLPRFATVPSGSLVIESAIKSPNHQQQSAGRTEASREPILNRSHIFASLLSSCLFSALLTGCTLTNTASPSPLAGLPISGAAFGGQQPITGSKVYLLAVNPAGYGSASLSLLTSAGTGNAVDTIGSYGLTDSVTGQFALAGEYDCTKGYALGASTSGTSTSTTLSGSEQVYLYILGGNPGSGTNTSVGLLAALGPCNAPYATKLVVNELTTVAAAYAFAGFATDATHIASSGTTLALTGLTNAGLNSANLVSISTGVPVASTLHITRPVATLYSLADILATCVNTDGTISGPATPTNCYSLLYNAQSAGTSGTVPTDTATAAINIAHNPGSSITALFGLIPSTGAPFTGGLTGQPNDFTLGLNYTGGGIYFPASIVIDAAGNALVPNLLGNSVSKISSTGTAAPFLSTVGGDPYNLAIDGSGNTWIVSTATITELLSNGTAITTSFVTNASGGIAIDASSNVWVSNGATQVAVLTSNGTAITGTNYSGGALNYPNGIAIDASGNAWIANNSGSSVTEFAGANGTLGTVLSGTTGYTGGGLNSPFSVAVDATGNAWINNGNSSGSLTELSGAPGTLGNPISGSNGYTGGGLNYPRGVAIDGSGNAWNANTSSNSISEFSNSGTALSPSTGYTSGNPYNPNGIAIDGSGDVWSNQVSGGSVTELIGAATPVVTPLVANLIAPYSHPASKP